MNQVHSGVWTNDDRIDAFYRYLPFEVPPGAAGVRIALSHDGGVLDLGCVGTEGFRGWSGGARSGFTIGTSAATPGYYPGEPEPGEWHVMLGLHRVPQPVSWRVNVEILSREPEITRPSAPEVPARPATRDLPAPAGYRWLAGDTHCHSVHSDGKWSLEELAAAAVEAGLDYLVITDHNTTSHHRLLSGISNKYGVRLIPGQEITTERGHANAFGDIGWIDFREPASQCLSTVNDRGGVLSANHPVAADCGWRQTVRTEAAEIWHCTWHDKTWTGPLAWWAIVPETTPLGGSDFHSPERDAPIGSPVTWICVPKDDNSTGAIIAAIQNGRTSVGSHRDGPALLPVDGALVAVNAERAVLTDFTGQRRAVRHQRHTFPAQSGPHWLEDAHGAVLALCRA